MFNLWRREKGEEHCRVVCREERDVGSLKLRDNAFRPRRHGQWHITTKHRLNDLRAALKINQLDREPVLLEETFFLSDVSLAEFSGNQASYSQLRHLATLRLTVKKDHRQKRKKAGCEPFHFKDGRFHSLTKIIHGVFALSPSMADRTRSGKRGKSLILTLSAS